MCQSSLQSLLATVLSQWKSRSIFLENQGIRPFTPFTMSWWKFPLSLFLPWLFVYLLLEELMDPHLQQLQVTINPFHNFLCWLDGSLVLLERHLFLGGYRQRLFLMGMVVRFFPFLSALTISGKIDLTVGEFFLGSRRGFFGGTHRFAQFFCWGFVDERKRRLLLLGWGF